MSALIVHKYGGSSVGTPERIQSIASRIAELHRKKIPLVVVVSAMGDTTDDLIRLAHQVSQNPPARELDMLLTAGERVSMALLSMALADRQVPAVSLTGSQSGIITSSHHGRAKIVKILGDRIRQNLAENRVVIVAGFQGVSESKEITTLGRGGSDTTAVALAASLQAKQCEIFTDVDGVFSADPRKVSGARFYPVLSHAFALELANRGAVVLHPRCIELARSFGVDVWVKNSLKPSEHCTHLVSEKNFMEKTKIVAVSAAAQRFWIQLELKRPGTSQAIWDWAIEKGLALAHSVQMGNRFSFFTERDNLAEWKALLAKAGAEGFLAKSDLREDIAPVSVVAEHLSQDSGMVSKVWSVVKKLEIEPTVFDVGGLALTLGVPAHRADEVVSALHAEVVS